MGVEPDGFEMVELDVEIVRETPRAYLVSDGARQTWVPKGLV